MIDMNEINRLTPVELTSTGIYVKREDTFKIGKSCGGKVRTCVALSKGAKGLTTAGSKSSPQVNIVSEIALQLGIPAVVFTPQGDLSPEVKLAVINGTKVYQVQAGYNNVIKKRSRDYAKKYGFTEIPFGMQNKEAIYQTRKQFSNLPFGKFKRIIMPVGSGMSLCGVLYGMIDAKVTIPVLGVVVGADPMERLAEYAPNGWKKVVTLVKSEYNYHSNYNNKEINHLDTIPLDPIYEAKCLPFIKDGDLFWIVGQRASMGIDTDWIDNEYDKVKDGRVLQLKKKPKFKV